MATNPKARVISMVQPKGGTGKSTGATIISGFAVREGYRVLVVDADPQASFTNWAEKTVGENVSESIKPLTEGWSDRLDFLQLTKHTQFQELTETFQENPANYDLVIFDTIGNEDSAAIPALVQMSDIVLSPTKSGDYNIASLKRVEAHLLNAKLANPTKKQGFYCFMNDVKLNTNVLAFAKKKIQEEVKTATLLPVALHSLAGFEETSHTGGLPGMWRSQSRTSSGKWVYEKDRAYLVAKAFFESLIEAGIIPKNPRIPLKEKNHG